MKLELKSMGRPPINTEALKKIKESKGQVIITKDEWKLADAPGRGLLLKKTGVEYQVRSLADNSGWLIKKV